MMKQYDSYKDSGVEWIGKIPSHWEVGRLKFAGSFDNGLTYSPNDITDESGILVLRSSNIQQSKLDYNDCVYVREAPKELIVDVGDIIICSRNGSANLVGKCAYVDTQIKATYGAFMMRFKPVIDKRFAFYLFKTTTDYYKGLFSTTTINQLTQGIISQMYIPSVPYLEQQAIASYLDKKCGEIDKAITTQEKRVELLKELRQNIITHAVTRGINHDAPLKDSGVEWIGEVPEHWEVNRLKTLCRTIRNGYVGPTRDLYVDDGIPYIQSVHIKDGDILFEREEYYVTKDWADKHPKIYKGDIVVVQTGDIGQIALVTNKFDKCNCHALIILSINNNVISSEYLSLYLRSHIGKELMLQTKTGALLPHLNSTQIGDTTTIVPPLSEQQEIVSYIESQTVRLDKSIEKAEHQIELLQELKQSIITEVVTGKRKVV